MDLTGQVFGRLTVISEAESSTYSFQPKNSTKRKTQRRRNWHCRCACGTLTVVTHGALKNHTTSCGCAKREDFIQRSTTHHMSNTPEHKTWMNMRRRCNNPQGSDIQDYKLRGITVCERWNSFENFFADMGIRPSARHSIERVDNDLGYSPGNCIWALPRIQGNNKRNNIVLTFQNQTHTLAEWSRIQHIDYAVLRARVRRYKWSVERALTEPVKILNRH